MSLYPVPPGPGWLRLAAMAWSAFWPFLVAFSLSEFLDFVTGQRKRRKKLAEKFAQAKKSATDERPPASLSLRDATVEQIRAELAFRTAGENGALVLVYSESASPTVMNYAIGNEAICMQGITRLVLHFTKPKPKP